MIRCFLKSDLFLSVNLRISDSLSQSFENLHPFIKRSVVRATSSGGEVRSSVADNLTSNSLELYGKSYVISTSFEWRLLKKSLKQLWSRLEELQIGQVEEISNSIDHTVNCSIKHAKTN